MKLKNKIALVTGASKGIGKAIALQFSLEGAAVALASRNIQSLTSVSEEINQIGGHSIVIPLDVSDPESIQQGIDKTVAHYGRLDIMVNNAGISMTVPSLEMTPEQWRLAVETNLSGVFFGCQAAARQMIKQNKGCIVNISSIFSKNAAPMRAPYCASKAGVDMLTQVLAAEWARYNIRVNAIAPGYVYTDLVKELIEKEVFDTKALKKRTPQNRLGEVDDIANAALFVSCDKSDFMTGSILVVDGGWSAYGYV